MLLAEKLKAYRLILASAPPRRRQLLVGCGLPFVQAEPYDVSETYPAGMPAGEVPVTWRGSSPTPIRYRSPRSTFW